MVANQYNNAPLLEGDSLKVSSHEDVSVERFSSSTSASISSGTQLAPLFHWPNARVHFSVYQL